MESKNVKLNDEFLKKVAFRVNELMIEEFEADPNAVIDGYKPSEKFKKAMKEMRERPVRRKGVRTVKAILIAAAILMLIFASAMSVSAIRRAVYDFFMSFGEDHAVVSYEAERRLSDAMENEEITEIAVYYEPTYLPDGYQVTEKKMTNMSYSVNYTNGVDSIRYKQVIKQSTALVDTEKELPNEVYIKDCLGFYTIGADSIHLMWNDSKYIYTIIVNTPDVEIEYVLRIAESVESIN